MYTIFNFSVASIQPSITAYLSEFHCNKNRAKWLSKINVFIASTFVVQPMLSLMFVTLGEIPLFNGFFVVKPWRLFLFTTSLIPMLCFLLMLNLPESPKFLFVQGKYRKTLQILRQMHHDNYKRSKQQKVSLYSEFLEFGRNFFLKSEVRITHKLNRIFLISCFDNKFKCMSHKNYKQKLKCGEAKNHEMLIIVYSNYYVLGISS